jgi:spermidine synthase
MLAQVRDPLLDILRTSPDFRPAYDPLLRMAARLSRTDPAQAQALFAELVRIQPARPEAVQRLDRLSHPAEPR